MRLMVARGRLAGAIALSGLTLGWADQAPHDRPSPDCRAVVDRETELRTPSGAFVYSEGESAARDGNEVAIAGAIGWVDSGPTRPLHSLIGVVYDVSSKRVLPIPAPLPDRALYDVHIAAAGHGAWNIVFATRLDTLTVGRGIPEPIADGDSALLWYARFDSSGLHNVAPITAVHSVSLNARMMQDFVSAEGDMYLAYGFNRVGVTHSIAVGNQGIVLLHGHPGAWAHDSLFANFVLSTQGIGLSLRPGTRILDVLVDYGYLDDWPRSYHYHAPVVFLFTFATGVWSPGVQVGDTAGRGVSQALLARLPASGNLVVSWVNAASDSADRLGQRASTMDPLFSGDLRSQVVRLAGGAVVQYPSVRVFGDALHYRVAALGDSTILWYVHQFTDPETHFAMLRHGAVIDLGTVVLRSGIFWQSVVGLSDSSFQVVSADTLSTSLGGTIVTDMHVSCQPQ